MAEFNYNPNFEIGRNFETLIKPGSGTFEYQMNGQNGGTTDVSYYRDLLSARPDLFGGAKIEDWFTPGQIALSGNESMGFQYGEGYTPTDAFHSALNPYGMQRRGASGLKDGRTNALVDAQGNIVFAGKPYQYDPAGDTLKSLGELGMLAGAAFGGLGLAGAGPWSGLSELFGGAAAGGTAAAEGAGATGAFGELGAMIPSGAELGALEGGSLLAGGAGIGGSLPAGLASFAVPAEIGMAGLGLGALPEFGMAGVDATQALAGGPMGLNGLGSTSAAANYGAAGASSGGLSSYIDKLLKPSTLKDVASAGMGVFNGINQRNQAKKLMGQLNGLTSPGGAYEQTLRKQLERRDAAAGRRSQYGPREVELQAKLAELASRNAPSLVGLMNSSNQGLESALRNLTGGGLKLFDIFGGG